MKDTIFYNQESIQYSEKRYPRVARSYVQFFFKRRLAITKKLLKKIIKQPSVPLSLLEVGCADGVIIRSIEKEFPAAFGNIVGIDIAAEMIETAREQNIFSNTEFYTRDLYNPAMPADIIIETGVINYANFEEEIAFAKSHLKPDGHYLFSIAGIGSLRNRLKGEEDFADFRPYKEYDRVVREEFTVLTVEGCGFFIPLIWRMPFVARLIQTLIDPIAGWVVPALCHEKIYLVKYSQ